MIGFDESGVGNTLLYRGGGLDVGIDGTGGGGGGGDDGCKK